MKGRLVPANLGLAMLSLLLWHFGATASATELDDARNAAPTMPFATEFDCLNAFDLFASFVMLSCAAIKDEPDDRAIIDRALSRLHELQLATPQNTAEIDIRFCPLLSGTGLVPAPGRVLLDDGLRAMSAEGLAEIIAHELVHVQQFEALGSAEFKCAYVRAMSACGGCQDRGHPLELAAYVAQDRARAALLSASGSAPAPVERHSPQPHAVAK